MLLHSPHHFLLLLWVALVVSPTMGVAQNRTLAPTNAPLLLTVEGKVEVSRGGGAVWTAGQPNQVLSPGDRIRTGERSRATIRLLDLSVLRVNEITTLEIRPPDPGGRKTLLDLKSGRSYLHNREKPTELQFRTPLASGAIRGTEFELSVADADGRTVVTMFEGQVALASAANAAGAEVVLNSGEQGVVEPGQPPRKSAVIDAVNIIQWTLYYPAVIAPDDLRLNNAERGALAESLAAYRAGDVLAALDKYPANRAPTSDADRIYRAALLLAAGQVEQTESALTSLSASSPLANALRKVIAAVKHRVLTADASANPGTASGWLAESYYRQSRSDLSGALDAAREATDRAPEFGCAWIRRAEMEASFGLTHSAMKSLDEGLRRAPRHAAGFALKGFIFSSRNQTRAAEEAFDQAIALDGALGNAWLGRGLVRLRCGDAIAGRSDLQVAAALEPNRAVLRSYLGKAFLQGNDRKRAERELDLAKKMDPSDPTSWLYSALVKQQENRPNRAIHDLERSKELNENRSVYRSDFLLDKDRAVRRANLAGIYQDAGLGTWGTREASRAVNDDYGNFSAHLFLANSYDALRDPRQINLRYESAWFSELLLADLLSPASVGVFPLTTSQEQSARFFERNHVGLVGDVEYSSHGDWITRGSQYGLIDNTSWAVDVFYQTNRGFRVNNGLEQLSLSAKFKQQVTPDDTFYLQVQTLESTSGDVAQYYYQSDASAVTRVIERQEPNLLAGWHHEWGPGSRTLFLGGWLNDDIDITSSNRTLLLNYGPNGELLSGFRIGRKVHYQTDFEAFTSELQQVWQNDVHTLIVGGRVQIGEAKTGEFNAAAPPARVTTDIDRYSAYGYYNWQVMPSLLLQAGLAYDYLNYPVNNSVPPFSTEQQHKDQVSPKAGFYFTPWKDTTLRGGYTRSLGGVYYDTSVRLEPTQIGGFNQTYRSIAPESVIGLVPGTEFETFGLAFDQKFPTGTYLTLAGEILYSYGERGVGAYDIGGTTVDSVNLNQTISYRERALSATVGQLLGEHWSLGARYRISTADLHAHFPDVVPTLTPRLQDTITRDEEATLQQAELFLNFYTRCGFFAQWTSIWSHQKNGGYENDLPPSDFWQHNVSAGYRFLNRRAEAQVSLLNIFDQDYRLNPLTLYAELPRERMLALRMRFFF